MYWRAAQGASGRRRGEKLARPWLGMAAEAAGGDAGLAPWQAGVFPADATIAQRPLQSPPLDSRRKETR